MPTPQTKTVAEKLRAAEAVGRSSGIKEGVQLGLDRAARWLELWSVDLGKSKTERKILETMAAALRATIDPEHQSPPGALKAPRGACPHCDARREYFAQKMRDSRAARRKQANG